MLRAELQTGIAQIDMEHEKLLMMLDELGRYCERFKETCGNCDHCDLEQQKKCDPKITALLGKLYDVAFAHFTHEENQMGLLPPALAEAHKYQHAELSEKLVSLSAHAASRAVIAKPMDIQRFVRNYLQKHIEKCDIP